MKSIIHFNKSKSTQKYLKILSITLIVSSIYAVLQPEDLRVALMPTLESLCVKPASSLFQDPLNTIKQKLNAQQYFDPWDFIADIYSIFDNARRLNRSTTKLNRSASKVVLHVIHHFSRIRFNILLNISVVWNIRDRNWSNNARTGILLWEKVQIRRENITLLR